MGCTKCGGRMLTKVGRKKPMLICTDCGHPINEVDDCANRRLRRNAWLIVLVLAAVAAMTLFITLMRGNAPAGSEPANPGASETQEEAQ